MTAPFTTLNEFKAMLATLTQPNPDAASAAMERNAVLTKPQGALGRLEDLAIWYAGWRGDEAPSIEKPQVVIFAGNHGVTAQGVSAFPAEVTAQMVINFQHGGAAINQLSRFAGAQLDVHALQLENPTQDFTQTCALSEAELVDALATGWASVDDNTDVLITGEMGIGNTTAAAAIFAALTDQDAENWTGRGTGVDDAGLATKTKVVAAGLARHKDSLSDPIEVLRCFGGREIAAMAGAIASARAKSIPVILDGFICTSAAMVLEKAQSGALDHCVAGHVSAEGAHSEALTILGKEPLLALGLRLGEGSGAGLAINILQAAVACHSGMATFAEAGVADS